MGVKNRFSGRSAQRVALAGLLFSVGILAAEQPSTTEAAVMALLQGYEWQIDEEAFATLGPDVHKTLIGIAGDMSLLPIYRARAAAVLHLYPNDEVWAFYTARVEDAEPVHRRRTVEALCDAFTDKRPQELGEVLMPLLDEDDVLLTSKAARCMQSLPGEDVERALRLYKARIDDPWQMRASGFEMEKKAGN